MNKKFIKRLIDEYELAIKSDDDYKCRMKLEILSNYILQGAEGWLGGLSLDIEFEGYEIHVFKGNHVTRVSFLGFGKLITMRKSPEMLTMEIFVDDDDGKMTNHNYYKTVNNS